MGALVTKALRPIRSFNIENRAHRIISKEKPTPAPRYPDNIEDLKRTLELEPDIADKLDKKDPGLDHRLRDVYVTSHGRPEDDITRELRDNRNLDRPLPQDRALIENYEFGFKEPEKLQYVSAPRNGSIGAASVGAASLGARRDAPSPKRAPSVRSDERPLATQGDLLNSIKFQRRLRDTFQANLTHEKIGLTNKEKSSMKDMASKVCTSSRSRPYAYGQDVSCSREKPRILSKGVTTTNNRPSSPKGRRNMQNQFL